MKVKIGDKIEEFQAIWMDKNRIRMIDQRKLPFSFQIYDAKNIDDVSAAIKEMVIRGAPAIGATAAYGLVQTAHIHRDEEWETFLSEFNAAARQLLRTRPTAVDLANIIEELKTKIDPALTIDKNIRILRSETEQLVQTIIEECKGIGKTGNELIEDGDKIMTICNAGALATVDVGTALAPIRKAHEQGKKIQVYVNETRPRLQGARLTAWELYNEEIDHAIIVDNAAGYMINNQEVDKVIVGADRIVRNGDVANKIGTYTLSVLCKENKIPFYVAAPRSSFDKKTKTGKEITIEQRHPNEVKTVLGVKNEKDKKPTRTIIQHPYSPKLNFAFDVTPAENITGIITAKGVLKPPFEEAITKFLEK